VNAIVFYLFYKESLCALLYCKGLKCTPNLIKFCYYGFKYLEHHSQMLQMFPNVLAEIKMSSNKL
jgi:hypothetical protein